MPLSSDEQKQLAQQVVNIGYRHARRLNMRREEAQDCAMEFAGRLLATDLPHMPSDAWIHRCAYNHACNYLRKLTGRARYERTWTERFVSAAEQRMLSQPSLLPGPKTLTLRRELWRNVFKALRQFSPDQQEIFINYHFRRVTIAQLANRYQRTPHAIEEVLSSTRKRLRQILHDQGWTLEEAQLLFCTPLRNPNTDKGK